MKRAPIIQKKAPPANEKETAHAAPVVDSLISRVGVMAKGNTIILPVCGRDVRFTLEFIPGELVETLTSVWDGNERDQSLLTEDAVGDLIPSFLLSGQQTPAFGRRLGDHIEVADGSRRRRTAIITSSVFRILTGELDDEQMDSLCKTGNDYRPTSAYERGKRYAARLSNEFANNVSALAEAENLSRKIISRCINTAKLPHEVITLFSHPGELSARAGETLQRGYAEKSELLLLTAEALHSKKRSGIILESEDILELLHAALKEPSARSNAVSRKQFAPGAVAQYRGNNVTFKLDRSRLPEECISRIEAILEQLSS